MADLRTQSSPNGKSPTYRCEVLAENLDFRVDPNRLGFTTTAELQPLDGVFGQDRALRALELGLSIRQRGYNVYVAGVEDAGRLDLVRHLLEARAVKEPAPDDWVYVHNFDEGDHPIALRLPAGQGVKLQSALKQLVERLQVDLPAALKAKDFGAERERLGTKYSEQSETLFDELVEHGKQLDLAVRRLPSGSLVFVPVKDGRAFDQEQLEKLSPEEEADLQRRQEELGEHAGALLGKQQDIFRQLRQEVLHLIQTSAQRILDPLLDRIRKDHPGEQLANWLAQLRDHVLDNLELFQEHEDKEPSDLDSAVRAAEHRDIYLPYRVNVVADNSRTPGAPTVVELSPNYKNLFGTIEHDINLFGRVSTNFTHIRPGSLLRANGGYLLFDLADALTEPLVWKQLKRVLKSGQLFTDVYEPFALLATAALKPEPIPLDTKVVVLGTLDLYYMLQFVDDEFRELFKVRADFGSEINCVPDVEQAYARFIARKVRDDRMPPFEAGAVAAVIRHGARLASHRAKVSLELEALSDLLTEAAYWARTAQSGTVTAAHVQQALQERISRNGRLADKVRELIQEGTLKIAIAGQKAGQINGLAVVDLGDFSFGRPSRVSASVGVGQEGLLNIERESDLSGSTHDKGILILEGYLRNRYAAKHPLALTASIAFEQSYGWIEGDSASAAELFCLLSALANVPLRQDIAVTGSVNQHGEIQAVGAVNEKVEGFFDVCQAAGLTGSQGVCLPRSNLLHLILRPDVIEAIRAGTFHVWAIDTVDEGIELLTGLPPGDTDQEGTFHYVLEQRLQQILRTLQETPAAEVGPRVRLGLAAPRQPALPPFPGNGD